MKNQDHLYIQDNDIIELGAPLNTVPDNTPNAYDFAAFAQRILPLEEEEVIELEAPVAEPSAEDDEIIELVTLVDDDNDDGFDDEESEDVIELDRPIGGGPFNKEFERKLFAQRAYKENRAPLHTADIFDDKPAQSPATKNEDSEYMVSLTELENEVMRYKKAQIAEPATNLEQLVDDITKQQMPGEIVETIHAGFTRDVPLREQKPIVSIISNPKALEDVLVEMTEKALTEKFMPRLEDMIKDTVSRVLKDEIDDAYK